MPEFSHDLQQRKAGFLIIESTCNTAVEPSGVGVRSVRRVP